MVDPEEHSNYKKKSTDYLIKKCPNCYEYLSLHAKVCTTCQAKVGGVDKLGFAQKPFDWWAYLVAVVTTVGFVFYMWWAFFLE